MVGNYFSHFIDCLSILLMVSFSEQKLFGLMESHLFIFAYVISAFRIKCKKSLPRPVSRSLVSIFSSRSFTVSGLMGGFISGFLLCSVYLYVYVLACSVLTLRDLMDYSLPGSSV